MRRVHDSAPKGIQPLVPFGHGGSYTSFEWGPASFTGAGTDIAIEVRITNGGYCAGSEVVQLYLAPAQRPERPPLQLAGFAKVRLTPGETGVARIRLGDQSFSQWDAESGWTVDPGRYDLLIAASATHVRSIVHHHIHPGEPTAVSVDE